MTQPEHQSSPSFRCLIVDDEPQARVVLRRHVEALDMLELKGECPNALAAFQFLQQQEVDLLFLDVQMPKVSGLELLRSLQQPPKVIFTTAFREHAAEAYELDVVDYLLKPIAFDRFLRAIQKAFRHVPLPASEDAEASPGQAPFLYFRADRRMIKVFLHEISYIESLKDYVRIATTKGESIITKQSISGLESTLPAHRFFRIHRSFIVNLQHVQAFNATEVEIQEQKLPVGRLYRAAWMERNRNFL
ncbi:LytR/AlgR family response regulator transcription factor [Haliscomenobacter sp.]|uniref:LytR/AlgR family response regulator transcription factor n=1 Tax=Haliscomenobacter sp. TaxID=2717303 RepID=UPI003BA887EE